MNKQNPVLMIMPADMVDMGGFPVRQPFPTRNVDQIDPFLLLHHANVEHKGGRSAKDVGIGPHPHRGFSPVTFIFEGDVHHRDSRGNSSIAKEGGVQWMDAGMGIIHSERTSEELAQNGGEQEIIQLWVNLPADKKMIQPHYQAIDKETQPVVFKGNGELRLVAGDYDGIKGPVDTKLPVNALMGRLGKGDKLTLKKPAGWSGFIYLLSGKIRIEGFGMVDKLNMVYLRGAAEEIPIEVLEETKILFLSGQPLEEEVTHYGPFVMTTQTEIMEAMRDYQQGKMGVLIEEF